MRGFLCMHVLIHYWVHGIPPRAYIAGIIMKNRCQANRALVLPLLLLFILLSGCASSSGSSESEGSEGATVVLEEAQLEIRQARIFIDGLDKGLTPKAIRIDRRFGYSEILLRIGKDRVRLFEIEQTTSSNSSALAYSFKGSTDGFYTTFFVEELPQKSEEHIYIPFRRDPLLITDRQYGLQIIVI